GEGRGGPGASRQPDAAGSCGPLTRWPAGQARNRGEPGACGGERGGRRSFTEGGSRVLPLAANGSPGSVLTESVGPLVALRVRVAGSYTGRSAHREKGCRAWGRSCRGGIPPCVG